MRVLIIILVLVFSLQSWSKADDISDFEIEGMSVGDSLLDHFTKKKITNAIKYGSLYPNSNKFLSVYIDVKKGRYNNFQFAIKPNDENYIIYSVEGEITYQNNMVECLKQQKIVIEDLKNFFPDTETSSNNSLTSF